MYALTYRPIYFPAPARNHGEWGQHHPEQSAQVKHALGRPSSQTTSNADAIPPRVQRRCSQGQRDNGFRSEHTQHPAHEDAIIRAKPDGSEPGALGFDVAAQVQRIRQGGRALSNAERVFFEPRFGRDFSQVRIHADSRAAQLAQALHARAFTIGRDVVFGAGQCSPSDGRQLLAHELTHVIQQGAAPRGAPSPVNDRARETAAGPPNIATLSSCAQGGPIQRRALPMATVAGLDLGGLRIFPPGLDVPIGTRELAIPLRTEEGRSYEERTLALWTPTRVTGSVTATGEAVPVGDRAGDFAGFAGVLGAQGFAVHQSAITMIVEDSDHRFHVLNVSGAPSTENPIRPARFSVIGHLGHLLGIRRAVNPNLRIATRGSATRAGGWTERVRIAEGLRRQYVDEDRLRDQQLWEQVERAYTELAVEALSVRPVDVYVMDYRRNRQPRPGLVNINLIAANVGGMAGPGELSEEQAPGQQRPWLYINWSAFRAGLDAVRSTFRHESIHAGTRERVLALMAHWRDAGTDVSFLPWLQRQRRLPRGGPARVTALDVQLAQAHLVGQHTDESLTTAMTFTTTFHRIPAAGMDTREMSPAFAQLRYMLAQWGASGWRRTGSGIATLRSETLRRLRVYYRAHLDPPHRAAFDAWVDGLPDSGGQIMVTHLFDSSTWSDVQGVVQQMRRFRHGV